MQEGRDRRRKEMEMKLISRERKVQRQIEENFKGKIQQEI